MWFRGLPCRILYGVGGDWFKVMILLECPYCLFARRDELVTSS